MIHIKLSDVEQVALETFGIYAPAESQAISDTMATYELCVLAALDEGALGFEAGDSERIISGLVGMAAAADERSENQKVDSLYRAWAKQDRRILTALSEKVRKAAAKAARS